MNLDQMNMKELQALRKDLDSKIDEKEKQYRNDAIEELNEVAKKYGFKLADLVSETGARKKAVVKPKYAHPDDPSKTWTGRGRKPLWVEDQLKEGKSLDDLKI